QVDAAQRGGRGGEQAAYALLARAVAGRSGAADLRGNGVGRLGVEVVDDDAGTLGGQASGQRCADAVPGTGDHGSAPLQRRDGVSHQTPPVSVSPPSTVRVWPVSQPASSESRNETTAPMSSGSPRRLSGYAAATSSSRPS